MRKVYRSKVEKNLNMYTQVQEYRTIARTPEELKRLQDIRCGLIRGDKKKIAEHCGVHRVWVSKVIAGEGTSEPVLSAAEQLIRERESQTN